jgi:aryl-alcohol dehydrogenase-like predicted oxidoreductase
MAALRPVSPDTAEPILSRVGLGTWAFGGVGWGPQSDRDSIATILRAVELGINWIDSASVYGGGHAERVVGAACAQLATCECPLVFTKGGLRIDTASGRTYRDLSPGSLRAECDASLRRLGLDRIDLYQLHWPVEDQDTVRLAWETLNELKREGKIRWAGLSNFGFTLLRHCTRLHPADAVQLRLSLIDRVAATDILPWTVRNGTRALVYSPLESGLLSGCFSPERLAALPAGDWRGRRPQFQRAQLLRTQALIELLRPTADELEASLPELAIAWALSWPGVSAAIVGARTPTQVEGWVGSASIRLDDPTLDGLALALARTRAGTGPTRPPTKPMG